MNPAKKQILLVEDDANDVFFLQHAFKTVGISAAVAVAEDGQHAIDYLSGAGQYADPRRFPFPHLVLLDLNLPGKTGFDVLEWIGKEPRLAALPVIVLTSSANVIDVDEAYRLGACSFLIKPLTMEKRVAVAKAIKEFWLDHNAFGRIPLDDITARTVSARA